MRIVVFALSLASIIAASGCATVPPYERETLASARMALDADPDEAYLVATRRRAREEGIIAAGAGTGGAASSGGGCGCN